jgi:hypothetical protein
MLAWPPSEKDLSGVNAKNTCKYLFFPIFLSSHRDELVGTRRHVVALLKFWNMSHPVGVLV